MSRLVVVHDVLGTLFSLTSPIKELETIFADQFQSDNGTPPILAELIIMDWYHATQRDFTTISINGEYQPIGAVFKSTLPRILLQAGLLPPDQFQKGEQGSTKTTKLTKAGSGLSLPGNQDPFPASVIDRIMSSLGNLEPRPGMIEAFTSTYRDEKLVPSKIKQVELWGATNGGLALGEKLFKAALGSNVKLFTGEGASNQQLVKDTKGIGLGLFSCDEIKVAKPDPKVYQAVRNRIDQGSQDSNDTSLWFVASHTWDLYAARKAGFKTAWVGYEEFYTCPDIFQRPDIIAADLQEAAIKILEWESKE